ncbi:MAG TPA: hypothetical protein VJU86_20310 [Pyrinomonadaceae bacterium]|nr:hypothetical protein [Pyrinomonadaceae bacterium]
MMKRLTSLVLLLMLASSVFAGMPLHSNEQSCPMGGAMAEMDCCKAALMQSKTPEVAAARLCCAVKCSNDGTAPSGNLRVPKSQPAVSVFHASTAILPNRVLLALHISRAHSPPFDSHPAYIRNLALLI